MGQKVNPVGFRVGVTHAWGSRWFAPKKTFGAFLVEDQKIREVCKKKLAEAGISKILVERYANRVRVTLFSARPGVIIGHKGGDVEAIRAELEKMTKKDERKYIVRERGNIRFDRAFSLPEGINEESIEAEFKNGILTVTLPKLPVKEPKKITVKVSA